MNFFSPAKSSLNKRLNFKKITENQNYGTLSDKDCFGLDSQMIFHVEASMVKSVF